MTQKRKMALKTFTLDSESINKLREIGKNTGQNQSEILRDLILDPGFLEALWVWMGITVQGKNLLPGEILLACFLAHIQEEMSEEDNPCCIKLQCHAVRYSGWNWRLNLAKLFVTWRKANRPCEKEYAFHEVEFDVMPGRKYLLVSGPGDDITEIKAAMLKHIKEIL